MGRHEQSVAAAVAAGCPHRDIESLAGFRLHR